MFPCGCPCREFPQLPRLTVYSRGKPLSRVEYSNVEIQGPYLTCPGSKCSDVIVCGARVESEYVLPVRRKVLMVFDVVVKMPIKHGARYEAWLSFICNSSRKKPIMNRVGLNILLGARRLPVCGSAGICLNLVKASSLPTDFSNQLQVVIRYLRFLFLDVSGWHGLADGQNDMDFILS